MPPTESRTPCRKGAVGRVQAGQILFQQSMRDQANLAIDFHGFGQSPRRKAYVSGICVRTLDTGIYFAKCDRTQLANIFVVNAAIRLGRLPSDIVMAQLLTFQSFH